MITRFIEQNTAIEATLQMKDLKKNARDVYTLTDDDMANAEAIVKILRLGYCFTPYQRLWLYNGAPLVAFYDTLRIRRTYSRLKPPASSRGVKILEPMKYLNL